MGQEIVQNKKGRIDNKNNLNSYNKFKEFKGKKYTGMKVGRSHKWYYEQGVWKERKIMPDKWDFTYDVKKRRVGNAPESSGVPIGTEYHWYILADQNVKKLDANNYNAIRDVSPKIQGNTRLFIARGKKDGMTKKRLAKFITEKVHITSGKIQDIYIQDTFSFITAPFREAELILKHFKTSLKGKKPIVVKAKSKS